LKLKLKKGKRKFAFDFVHPAFKIESNSTLLNIFPNPSSGVFNVQSDNQLENVQITVTDLQGRTLINTLFSGNETTVDLSNYTQGVYLLQLHSSNVVQTYKLIKD